MYRVVNMEWGGSSSCLVDSWQGGVCEWVRLSKLRFLCVDDLVPFGSC